MGLRVRIQGQRLGLGVGFSVKGWVWANVGFRGRVYGQRLGLEVGSKVEFGG